MHSVCWALLNNAFMEHSCQLQQFKLYVPIFDRNYIPANLHPFTYYLCGSFQKFCTLYVFSLKMNLFYKIHLQAFNVISTVLYHNGPTFGKVLYSCLNAFVVDASDYSGHLIRHILNASEAFPKEWFLQQVKVWWAQPNRLWLVPKNPLRGKRLRNTEVVSNEVT
jgi:hypothetical protein